MPDDVFISYESADARHCARLRRLLEQELDVAVLVDRKDSVFGVAGTTIAGDRRRDGGTTFVIMTRHTRDADWLTWEVAEACARDRRLVPVVFDDAAARDAIAAPDLRHHRFVDARLPDEDLVVALWRCLHAGRHAAIVAAGHAGHEDGAIGSQRVAA